MTSVVLLEPVDVVTVRPIVYCPVVSGLNVVHMVVVLSSVLFDPAGRLCIVQATEVIVPPSKSFAER
jgi:hypothetical protein